MVVDMTAATAATAPTTTTTNPEQLLPPGFRFHPTDEELILHYLRNRANAIPCPVSIIAEVDIYKFNPWELPAKAVFGDREWYFFSPRDRKYPNGVRPNRAAGSGYWKATGTDKPILLSGTTRKESVGVKKALVFYKGKPPKGSKTNWIMHEYRLPESAGGKNGGPAVARRLFEEHQQFHFGNSSNKLPANDSSSSSSSSSSMRLDDWVLCRIYEKTNHSNNSTAHPSRHQQHSAGSTLEPDHCADGDLDMEDSSNNYVPSPFTHNAPNTTTATTTLNRHQYQEHENLYVSLPKAASLSDLLAEADISMVSRLIYETPAPPPTEVATTAGHLIPVPNIRSTPPSSCQQSRNVQSMNAVAASNIPLTIKRQLVWPETGCVEQQPQASKKQRHAADTFTGQGSRLSAYDNVMNGCSTFTPSTCNLAAASNGAHPLLLDAAPGHPQLNMMTTNSINNTSTTTPHHYIMGGLYQQYLQMQP